MPCDPEADDRHANNYGDNGESERCTRNRKQQGESQESNDHAQHHALRSHVPPFQTDGTFGRIVERVVADWCGMSIDEAQRTIATDWTTVVPTPP
jgi:hypothetical protein